MEKHPSDDVNSSIRRCMRDAAQESGNDGVLKGVTRPADNESIVSCSNHHKMDSRMER